MRAPIFVCCLASVALLAACSGDDPAASTDGAAGAASGHGTVASGHRGAVAGVGGASIGGQGGATTSGGGAGTGPAGAAGTAGKMASGGASNGGAGGSVSIAGQGGAGVGGRSPSGGSGGSAPSDVPAAVLAYPVTCPAPGFGNTNVVAPIVIDGSDGMVIDGVNVTNPGGPCITIQNGASHVTIKNSVIGPCLGAGIQVSHATAVSIENDYISQTTGNGVDAYQVTGLTVDSSCIEHVATGVYVDTGTGVAIEHNAVKNVQGPIPRGQLTQFNNVSGPGNRVRCNVGDNVAGESNPEDEINIYQSNGTSDSPILIEGNRVRGGGPSTSGGGMMIGDGGQSSWSVLRGNVLVNPGQYGIAVPGGTNMVLDSNTVFAISQSFTNVGAYVWNQYDSACGPVMVTHNQVDFTNADGEKNGFFDGSQTPSDPSYPICTDTTVDDTNDWSATLPDSIIDAVPPMCP